jgi:hypothetical protein
MIKFLKKEYLSKFGNLLKKSLNLQQKMSKIPHTKRGCPEYSALLRKSLFFLIGQR